MDLKKKKQHTGLQRSIIECLCSPAGDGKQPIICTQTFVADESPGKYEYNEKVKGIKIFSKGKRTLTVK